MHPAEQALETFRRLLDLTPEPPMGGDAATIIKEGESMLDQRATELAILKLLLDETPHLLEGNRECQAIRDDLGLRDRRWNDALLWAKTELAKQRLAAQRARQAQRAYDTIRP